MLFYTNYTEMVSHTLEDALDKQMWSRARFQSHPIITSINPKCFASSLFLMLLDYNINKSLIIIITKKIQKKNKNNNNKKDAKAFQNNNSPKLKTSVLICLLN